MSPLQLPERPSLEYLKRLAKEHLAALRQTDPRAKLATFFAACQQGDVESLLPALEAQPDLVRERNSAGQTGLHLAARHESAVQLLLAHGADPNARDLGDNAGPLHYAAQNGALGSIRFRLDGQHEHDGVLDWAALSFGDGHLTFVPGGSTQGHADVTRVRRRRPQRLPLVLHRFLSTRHPWPC